MPRKFKVKGNVYDCIKIGEWPNENTITFTKHDIGTWNAHLEELNDWIQARTKEEALFLLMVKHFGVIHEK